MLSLVKENDEEDIVNPNEKDLPLIGSPMDTVTTMSWSRTGSCFLAAGAWSGELRVWETLLSPSLFAIPRFVFNGGGAAAPVLSSLSDANAFFWGDVDGELRYATILRPELQLKFCSGTEKTAHLSGVTGIATGVAYSVISSSWDQTMKFYDLRVGMASIHTQFCSSPLHCLDAKEHLIAVGTADNEVISWDARNMKGPLTEHYSPGSLIRSLAICPDLSGYVSGTIDGRCSVMYYVSAESDAKEDKTQEPHTYSWKCHRQVLGHAQPAPVMTFSGRRHATTGVAGGMATTATAVNAYAVYAVNAIDFRPRSPTNDCLDVMATAGADGRYAVWNHRKQIRLQCNPDAVSHSLTSLRWAPDGNSFVYAAGNDFSSGTTSSTSRIYWHPYTEKITKTS